LRLAWRRLALAAAIGFAACDSRPPSDWNVVWVVLDAAGASHFGIYGNKLPTTPNIDALAADATVFDRAYSQAAWTPASTASFLTGKYPRGSMYGVGLPEVVSGQGLASLLAREGLRTAGFSENPYVTRKFGFADGFEVFNEYFPYQLIEDKPLDYSRTDSARTVREAIAWIQTQGADPFFLYLHLLPPHSPYDPPAPFAGAFDPDYAGSVQGSARTLVEINRGELAISSRDLIHLRLQYQENLAFGDHQVGLLLDALRELRIRDRTLIVISADHGEAFREHGLMLHNQTLFQEMIHVPLIIRFPPALGELPARWPGAVELRQIYATVCEVLGVRRCDRDASGLLSILREADPDDAVALAFSTNRKGTPIAAAVSGRYKLITRYPRLRPIALFDLEADPREKRSIAASHRGVVDRLLGSLREPGRQEVEIVPGDLDPATKRRLRALGYVD